MKQKVDFISNQNPADAAAASRSAISNNGHKPVGAALVVGAGIGGMQASLDLAEAGIKVYLLDSAPAIGGVMAQLDKTFPTNDCAMCIMSPKLVEVGRHLNIDILTTAELLEVNGEPGHFKAKIRKHPRYVIKESCTSCGDCSAACPVVRPDAFNEELSDRKAIYKLYPQAIPNTYAIEKLGVAPCRSACPIHQRAQGYVALIREGRFADAYRTIKEDNPFPSVCGRVCNHRCEDDCSRGEGDQPVNIMALKRFVTDWVREHPDQLKPPAQVDVSSTGKHVAVIGAGPAGLTCALDLVRQGHAVTVFEALPVAGGMMRVGVPSYRQPYDLVQEEIDQILAEGVDLRLNSPVKDPSALLEQGFDAVFAAIGAHKGIKLPIPGVDLPGVLSGIDFLRQVSLGWQAETGQSVPHDVAALVKGKRVLVLGGGNVAIDTAMTAVRVGAGWVGMACLESREKMPAHDWEVRDAEEEGIQVFPSRTFKEITGQNGQLSGIRCVTVDFRGFVDGRPDFTEFPETEEHIPVDVILFATGQHPDLGLLAGQVETIRGRFVKVNPDTLETSRPGIFAGGDAVTGTSFIVDGIAAGHKAARSIGQFLAGQEINPAQPMPPTLKLEQHEILHKLADEKVAKIRRVEMTPRPAEQRKLDFGEVYAGLTEEQAKEEAARCLSCGICSECLQCVYACQAKAIDHNMQEEVIELDVGAVILTPGLEPVEAGIRPEYG
ncbi:MAG: FAD-dependent oxidoreductase, partial [Anaerolineaceae bacterium]